MITAKGRAKLTIDGRELGRDEHAAHREAVADALGDCDDVGTYAKVLMREELAAAAIAALYLVADKDGVVLIAKFAKRLQEVGTDHADAAHALNAFEDAGTGVALLYLAFPSIYVVERQVGDVSIGIDWSDNLGVVRCLHSQRGAAVESFLKGKDAGASVIEGCQFQGILVGLSSAVDKEKAVVLVAASLAQALGELFLQRVLHGVAVEAQPCYLLTDSLHVMRMGMSHADDGVTAIEVEVFLSLAVPDAAALASGYGHVHEGINIK